MVNTDGINTITQMKQFKDIPYIRPDMDALKEAFQKNKNHTYNQEINLILHGNPD